MLIQDVFLEIKILSLIYLKFKIDLVEQICNLKRNFLFLRYNS